MGPSKPVTPSAGLTLLWFVALVVSALAFSTLEIFARDAWTTWRNARTAHSLGLPDLAPTPAPPKPAFLAARDGSLYLAVADESRFPLYRARDFASPWLPIAGASAVGGFFENESGDILAAGRKLGRSAGADWRFSDWIAGADAEEIAADGTGRRILAWGRGRIYLSGDAGETFHACPTGDVVAASAFFPDARRPDAVVLDRRGQGYRLDESLCR